MRLPSWPSILAVTGGAGLGTGVMWYLVQGQRERLANEATFIERAISITREQDTIKRLLGDNFEVGKIKMTDGWSKMRPLEVQLRVPVRGELDSAFLYAYARRQNEKQSLRLYKLEATFNKIAGKKLLIMDHSDKVDQDDDDHGGGGGDKLEVTKKSDKRDKELAKELSRKKTVEEIKAEMKSWTAK